MATKWPQSSTKWLAKFNVHGHLPWYWFLISNYPSTLATAFKKKKYLWFGPLCVCVKIIAYFIKVYPSKIRSKSRDHANQSVIITTQVTSIFCWQAPSPCTCSSLLWLICSCTYTCASMVQLRGRIYMSALDGPVAPVQLSQLLQLLHACMQGAKSIQLSA